MTDLWSGQQASVLVAYNWIPNKLQIEDLQLYTVVCKNKNILPMMVSIIYMKKELSDHNWSLKPAWKINHSMEIKLC